jgi:uncharacterized protein YgbK (DUF1537 family)
VSGGPTSGQVGGPGWGIKTGPANGPATGPGDGGGTATLGGLVIVSDDLTGAADAAAAYGPFADVAVALDVTAELPAADVIAMDTDSRHRSPAFAAQAVRSAVRAAVAAGLPLYKKIDSTLRGNIGVEVASALHELSATALLAPSFPGTGRTVTGGILHVDGTPIERGDIRAHFAGTGLRTALVPLATVRQGAAAVVAAHTEHRADGAAVICADAVTDDDLEILDSAAAALGPRVLPVGSAGLTRVAVRGRRPRTRPAPPRPSGPVFTVLGSYSALAREQRAALTGSGEVTLVPLKAPFRLGEQRRAAERLAGIGGDTLLVPDPDAAVERAHATEVAAALAAVAQRCLNQRETAVGGLVLAGGETARAVLLALGVSGFTVLGELEPGVVHSIVPAGGPAVRGVPLITKAGAFGDPATLERARRTLHGQIAGAVR